MVELGAIAAANVRECPRNRLIGALRIGAARAIRSRCAKTCTVALHMPLHSHFPSPREPRRAGLGMFAGFDRALWMRCVVLPHTVESEAARDFIAAHSAVLQFLNLAEVRSL